MISNLKASMESSMKSEISIENATFHNELIEIYTEIFYLHDKAAVDEFLKEGGEFNLLKDLYLCYVSKPFAKDYVCKLATDIEEVIIRSQSAAIEILMKRFALAEKMIYFNTLQSRVIAVINASLDIEAKKKLIFTYFKELFSFEEIEEHHIACCNELVRFTIPETMNDPALIAQLNFIIYQLKNKKIVTPISQRSSEVENALAREIVKCVNSFASRCRDRFEGYDYPELHIGSLSEILNNLKVRLNYCPEAVDTLKLIVVEHIDLMLKSEDPSWGSMDKLQSALALKICILAVYLKSLYFLVNRCPDAWITADFDINSLRNEMQSLKLSYSLEITINNFIKMSEKANYFKSKFFSFHKPDPKSVYIEKWAEKSNSFPELINDYKLENIFITKRI